jgi:Leucine-rich repeat (LRR) protein
MSGSSSPIRGPGNPGPAHDRDVVRHQLTVLTAEQFQMLANAWMGAPLRGRVSNGGEALPGDLLARLYRLEPRTIDALISDETEQRMMEQRMMEDDLRRYVDEKPDEAGRVQVRERILQLLRSRETSLNLAGLEFSRLPQSISLLRGLQNLHLRECRGLTTLEGLQSLPSLQTLNLSGCEGLTTLQGLQNLPNLQDLNLASCTRLSTLQGLQNLPNLQTLDLRTCVRLPTLQGLQNLPNLQRLKLGWCHGLTNLQGLQNLTNLQTLDLGDCGGLATLQGLQNLPSLQNLDLGICTSLTTLQGLQNLQNLQDLNLRGCRGLTTLQGLQNLQNLQNLNLQWCRGLTTLQGLQNLQNLQTLNLSECLGLSTLQGLPDLPNLQTLNLSDCESLTTLEGLPDLPNLQTLDLRGCERLSFQTIQAVLGTLPAHCRVHAPQLQPAAPQTVRLNRLDLEERPLVILGQLARYIEDGQPFTVQFGEEPSIDAGGPRRELITLLVRNVFLPNQLPYQGSLDEADLLPTIPTDADPDGARALAQHLSQLGQVLGYAPRLPATIGPLFDPRFFPALIAAYRLPDPVQDPDIASIGLLAGGVNLEEWFPTDFDGLTRTDQVHVNALNNALQEQENEASSELLSRLHALRSLAQQDLLGAFASLREPELARQLQRGALNEEGLLALARVPGFPPDILEELFKAHAHEQQTLSQQRAALGEEIQRLTTALANANEGGKRAAQFRLDQAKKRLTQLQSTVGISPDQRQATHDALQSRPEILELVDDLQNRCALDLQNMRKQYTDYLLTNNPAYQEIGRATVAISRGMKQHLTQNPALQVPDTLKTTLVGASSAAEILARIEWSRDFGEQAPIKQWLREWLDTATDAQRSLFCQAVTASPALPPGSKRISVIKVDRADLLPAAHTCSFQLDLPEYATQEEFNQKMSTFLEHASAGYGFA